MSTEPPALVYLDVGAISRLGYPDFRSTEFTLAFSEATLLDLKNSNDPMREIEYLQEQHAVFLSNEGDSVFRQLANVVEQFRTKDSFGVDALGKLIAFLNGGREDMTLLESMYELIAGTTSESVADAIKHGEESNDPHITNRQIERDLDRIFQLHVKNDHASLKELLSTLPSGEREYFLETFPPRPSNFNQAIVSAVALGMIGLARSKGLRKRGRASVRTGAHEYLDCLHVAFALHCNLFITNDNATHAKAQKLSEYWNLGTVCCLLKKE